MRLEGKTSGWTISPFIIAFVTLPYHPLGKRFLLGRLLIKGFPNGIYSTKDNRVINSSSENNLWSTKCGFNSKRIQIRGLQEQINFLSQDQLGQLYKRR